MSCFDYMVISGGVVRGQPCGVMTLDLGDRK